ncbi:hypothetical protein [Photobacterium damselae]|uniref:hypothetical protein n=1 Tax=Photobacterium damselae TaxID=38293 RepID=UPI000D9D50E6|nr:hypothetical protein [Photobacterium damselae]SPY30045.1 Uncharacterised protein [Photobacterium damselae]
MNPFELPRDRFKARRDLLKSSIEVVLSETSEYIYAEYQELEKLERAELFCKYELMEAPSARVDHLQKVGIFPWVEAAHELDSCLTVIFEGNYKNAFDSLRRAIELVVTGSFFVLDNVEQGKAREWMESDRSTPNFKRALKVIEDACQYSGCDEEVSWTKSLLGHYWELCDVIHVKGVKNSSSEISPRHSFISGVSIPHFDQKACNLSLSYYLKTVELVALMVALSNPVLLVGFDLERKFGLNAPMSGFYNSAQSDRLTSLIPDRFKPFIKTLIDSDRNIALVSQWFDSLPDITEEELELQMKKQDELFGNFTEQNNLS